MSLQYDLEYLEESLADYVRDVGLAITKEKILAYVKYILERQNGVCALKATCFLKNQLNKEQKLQWERIVPMYYDMEEPITNFFLICNNCAECLRISRNFSILKNRLF
jgi:hypothetical protein